MNNYTEKLASISKKIEESESPNEISQLKRQRKQLLVELKIEEEGAPRNRDRNKYHFK